MTAIRPDLLRALAPADAAAVLRLGTSRHVACGSNIFGLGEPADCLFVIDTGRVALTLPVQVGGRHEHVLIEERVSGDTIGWSALIPPHRFTLNATADLECDLVVLGRETLFDHLQAHPAVGFTIARSVAETIGRRLQVFQAMWLRQMQRVVKVHAPRPGQP
jgi:CRP/FNR family cyclic AMP-dependent transcriptional regulator